MGIVTFILGLMIGYWMEHYTRPRYVADVMDVTSRALDAPSTTESEGDREDVLADVSANTASDVNVASAEESGDGFYFGGVFDVFDGFDGFG